MANVDLLHIAAGCNRVNNALDWGGIDFAHSFIAYAAHNNVLLYDVQGDCVLCVLTGHTGRVNCIRWLPSGGHIPCMPGQPPKYPSLLLTGSCDGTVRLWYIDAAVALRSQRRAGGSKSCTRDDDGDGHQAVPWRLGCTASINSISVAYVDTNDNSSTASSLSIVVAASTASDTVHFWHTALDTTQQDTTQQDTTQQTAVCAPAAAAGGVETSTTKHIAPVPTMLTCAAWEHVQIQPAPVLHIACALVAVPGCTGWILCACGGSDGKVRLLLRSPVGVITTACTLTGHMDWVKAIDFTTVNMNENPALVLATAGQDKYVRMWTLQIHPGDVVEEAQEEDAITRFVAATRFTIHPTPNTDATAPTSPLTTVTIKSTAVLIGHEDWVHCLRFRPTPPPTPPAPMQPNTPNTQRPTRPALPDLVSCSMDRTMVVWRVEPSSGLWMAEASYGDAGGLASLGYYTCCWAPDGGGLVAHGFTGALHVWEQPDDGDVHDVGGWHPRHACGGHYGPITDLTWAFEGALIPNHDEATTHRTQHTTNAHHTNTTHNTITTHDNTTTHHKTTTKTKHRPSCLLTVSADQTTRLTTQASDRSWLELARPQVHGHNLSCIAALPVVSNSAALPVQGGGAGEGSHEGGEGGSHGGVGVDTSHGGADHHGVGDAYGCVFATGSEEKVLRVFEAPEAFLQSWAWAVGGGDWGVVITVKGMAQGALVTALGLSNQALYDEDVRTAVEQGGGHLPQITAEGPDIAPHAAPRALCEKPFEETLSQSTLWPETHKLYGHGNDLYAVAGDPRGALFVSSCRAQSSATAALWVWDVQRWAPAGPPIEAATLTVTRIVFSPCGGWLLCSSRDRSIVLLKRREHGALSALGAVRAEGVEGDGQHGESTPGEEQAPFTVVHRVLKAHTRIVWDVCWSPCGRLAASSSRDGSVKLWCLEQAQLHPVFAGAQKQQGVQQQEVPQGAGGVQQVVGRQGVQQGGAGGKPFVLGPLPSAVTSIAFCPTVLPSSSSSSSSSSSMRLVLAVGCEDGQVSLYTLELAHYTGAQDDSVVGNPSVRWMVLECECVWQVPAWCRHVATVRRLAWRAVEGNNTWQLASCGDDHALMVFNVEVV